MSFEFAKRFNRFLDDSELDQSELARRLGITSQAVNQWATGDTEPQGPRLKLVAKELKVSVTDLLGIETVTPATLSNPRTRLDPVIFSPPCEPPSSGNALPETLRIKELDVTAQAGPGAADIDEATGHKVLAEWEMPSDYLRSHVASVTDIRMIRVKGDSMEPEYPSGDRVLVDTGHRVASPAGVYVLWDGFGLVLKRLEIVLGTEGDMVRISSTNPAYPPYERPVSSLAINGRVIGKWMWK